MRIAFMGTPEFAVGALEELVAAGHEVAALGVERELQLLHDDGDALAHRLGDAARVGQHRPVL